MSTLPWSSTAGRGTGHSISRFGRVGHVGYEAVGSPCPCPLAPFPAGPQTSSCRQTPCGNDSGVAMPMLRNKQRNQHVDVQKADHGQGYSPAPSARRSTSSMDSVVAPGRRGNTGTPRSNRMSAFAIRLSNALTNSSTRCPDWLARSASRSFNAASTVIVAFGITSLSHDVTTGANCEAVCPSSHNVTTCRRSGEPEFGPTNFRRCGNQRFQSSPNLPWRRGSLDRPRRCDPERSNSAKRNSAACAADLTARTGCHASGQDVAILED